MKEYIDQIDQFLAKNKRFAVATVIQTWGSAPRPVGSTMIVSEDLEMWGSVSGGCVEGAILKAVPNVLKNNKPLRLGFGVTDEEAWAVGLSCGGQIQVFIEPFLGLNEQKKWDILRGGILENRGAVLLTHLNDEQNEHILVLPNGETMGERTSDFLAQNALRAYSERKTQTLETPEGEQWFVQVFPPKPKLVVVGAAHIAVDLVHLAQYFGFETIVIDPRGIFAEKTQFSTPPDQLFVDWPAEVLPDMTLDAYTFAVMLTHDPKIDDQALHILLTSNVAYIGALGSKKTHEKRVKRLIQAGFSDTLIAKIHAPIGVNIQAKSAREIALSIVGELIKVKNQFL
ncbi:MAG: XdhC family protein [Saprospiraceae bacterium]|nr:XdhC family protein [Saprospiraceae bacterium]